MDRLPLIEREYEDVVAQLSDPAVLGDQRALVELSRRRKELEGVVAAYREREQAALDLAAAKEMLAEAAASEEEVARAEHERAASRLEEAERLLEAILVPRDENDGRNVIVEIRGAEGGEEANLFARDLFDMYARFSARMGWAVEVLSSDPSERGGLNEVSLVVRGPDAWRRMKHEAGTHRVQRVPVTESQGRIHTSSATVTVLPEPEELDVSIDPSDLKVEVYRSTGPGGQSVNTTDSAVRITHLPTGIVVSMQDEKSQLQNRAKALRILRARLLQAEQERQSEQLSRTRRSQIGRGGRSEKVRTYNFRDNRVTDHRIGVTLHQLDRVLLGELDQLSDALLADERARQLQGQPEGTPARP
jgi:peptide chain release factor 1